jgi:hypothetical protein
MPAGELDERIGNYGLFDALLQRRSRRFAKGMNMPVGPLRFASALPSEPLSQDEIAALAFAACGVTGYALADLVYAQGQGGTMMGGFLGRTVSSADAIHSVSVIITGDDGTWLLKRPEEFAPSEYPELVELARRGALTELYRRSRIALSKERAAPSLDVPNNLDCNRWDMYRPGTTYFLPVNDYTYMYINGLLELMNESTGVFIVDERAGFRPAGLARFAKSKGGHLYDDPQAQRSITVERLETLLHSVVTVEQGMVLQNLGLMAQALGVGGFPNFASHEFAWFEALGFRLIETTTLRYLGANPLLRWIAGLLGRDPRVRFPVGLERNGEVLLSSYCPPYYPTMEAAVHAVVERKFGARGIYRGGVTQSSWSEPNSVGQACAPPTERTIAAVVAYASYIHDKYFRFPAYPAPFRTCIGFQAAHLDLGFYERFYRPEAVSDTHRQHHERWHRSP